MFIMENLKVGLKKGRGFSKIFSGVVYDGKYKGNLFLISQDSIITISTMSEFVKRSFSDYRAFR